MGYLDGGVYLLSENLSIFTAAEHVKRQPVLLISMLLFHVYLTVGFSLSHFQWSGFLPPWSLIGKAHAPYDCPGVTYPPWPTPWNTSCHSPTPLSLSLATSKTECALWPVPLSTFAERMPRDQEVLIQSSVLFQSLVT